MLNFTQFLNQLSYNIQETYSYFIDIVKEILENRAEIYQALDKSTPDLDIEEEGPSVQEMMLMDHIKLTKAIVDEEVTDDQEEQ